MIYSPIRICVSFCFMILSANFLMEVGTLEGTDKVFPFAEIMQEENKEVIYEKVRQFHEGRVMVRGFLYQASEGEQKGKWILSTEPQLRSCCIGSKIKAMKQIVISDEMFKGGEVGQVVELSGVFFFDPLLGDFDQAGAFQLKDVNLNIYKSIDYKYFTLSLFVVVSGFIIFFVIRRFHSQT